MIFTDSRYAKGKLVSLYKNSSKQSVPTLFRKFPKATSDYFLYVWKETDRIDQISKVFLGSAAKWWRIMDFNPEIIDPFTIATGTTLRIPNVG
jgi:hypothetical protein